jgi:Flp pilus assembly protein TadD
MEQARVLQMRGETEAAVTMLIQQGIGVAVDWPAPYLALAELLMREQRFAAAMQVVPEMPPATERTVMREIEAICHCALGDDEAAQRAANQAPGRPRALVVLGTLAARRGDLSEAETFIRRAIEVDSSCGSAWLSLGMLLWGLGKQEDAWQAIKRSVMVDPLNGEAVRILKDMAERLERISEVTELIDEVAKTFPESRNLYRICTDGKNHD